LAKILLLVVVAVAVYFIFRTYARSIGRKDPPPEAPPRGGPKAEDMVRCRECGIHLPRSEAVTVLGEHYCCEQHGRSHSSR
jgi:uncharacterized protein